MVRSKTGVVEKPITLVIAGPGAGKTYEMVSHVLDKLPMLSPFKFMAVITYTNAATEQIQSDLHKKCNLPHNVFIGTIHSFLNRFILTPHGKLVGVIPQEIKFIDDIEVAPHKLASADKTKKILIRNAIRKNARKKGYITYSDIERLSASIICDKTVNPNYLATRKAVATRLQFIFADEYQDATSTQHKILMELMKENMTKLFCVGDPEQYIYGFTYGGKNQKLPAFSDIPIMKTKNNPLVKQIDMDINRRSTKSIIDFLNHFNTQMKQLPFGASDGKNHDTFIPVQFSSNTDLKQLCKTFDVECKNANIDQNCFKLILAYDNDLVDRIAVIANCGRISNDAIKPKSILRESLRFMAGVVGLSQKQIQEQLGLDIIGWRKKGFQFLNTIRNVSTPNITLEDGKKFTENILKIKRAKEPDFESMISESFGRILNWKNEAQMTGKACSTIHKAKGLQADGVLVIAGDKKELIKWVESDKNKRLTDKLDVCRIGFVGFSRAKRLLMIGCIEPINSNETKLLKDYGVKII